MDQLSIQYLTWDDRTNLIEILNFIANNELISYFSFSIEEILLSLSANINYHFQIDALAKLISDQQIYSEVIEDSKNSDSEYFARFQSNIDKAWFNSIDYFMTQTGGLDTFLKKDDLVIAINERKAIAKKINKVLILDGSSAIEEYILIMILNWKKIS